MNDAEDNNAYAIANLSRTAWIIEYRENVKKGPLTPTSLTSCEVVGFCNTKVDAVEALRKLAVQWFFKWNKNPDIAPNYDPFAWKSNVRENLLKLSKAAVWYDGDDPRIVYTERFVMMPAAYIFSYDTEVNFCGQFVAREIPIIIVSRTSPSTSSPPVSSSSATPSRPSNIPPQPSNPINIPNAAASKSQTLQTQTHSIRNLLHQQQQPSLLQLDVTELAEKIRESATRSQNASDSIPSLARSSSRSSVPACQSTYQPRPENPLFQLHQNYGEENEDDDESDDE